MNQRLTEGRWLEVQKRSKRVLSLDGKEKRVELTHWYGRLKVKGKWKWFKLFTDRRASQQRWNEIIREHEQRDAGVITPQMDQAKLPLSKHLEDYCADLNRRSSRAHHRITKGMLERFIAAGGWKTLGEIDEASTRRVLAALEKSGWKHAKTLKHEQYTVAHINKHLSKLKTFLLWCTPERIAHNPLAKLKKANERKAMKRRAKRPLSPEQVAALLTTVPETRRLKYAIAIFAGLRRGEAKKLIWDDVKLDAVIPHLRLRAEMTKTGVAAALPLHPYLVTEFRRVGPLMPAVAVFDSIPNRITVSDDLTAACIPIVDEHGRRAGYHGLRYTFATLLDETGASHGTRRALMRHGSGDMTDGYTVARLSEMNEAVKRLPAPSVKKVDTEWTRTGPTTATTGSDKVAELLHLCREIARENQGKSSVGQSPAAIALHLHPTPDILAEIGTRSSIG